MPRRRSTRNPVRVRAVQFSSRLVGTNGCGQVRHDSGRVRPARFLACGRATAQIGPENSAGSGSGSMFESECHALLVGSILPCGLSPLYHEYRGSTLNRPEVFLLTRDRIMKFVDDSRPTRMSGGYKRGFMNLAKMLWQLRCKGWRKKMCRFEDWHWSKLHSMDTP